MFGRKSLVFCTVLLLLAAVLSGQGSAASRFVSGTPLIPPVPPGTPSPKDPIITKASLSLLGDSSKTLPLREEFFVTLFSGSGMRKVTADLYYPRDGVPAGSLNVYVETGVQVSQQVISTLVSEFEGTIRPVINQYFGTESDIDNNGQITLLITALDSSSIGGYFDSRNQYSSQWVANSNEREMIYINSLMLDFGIDGVLQTLAHEFTHLVQWNYNWNYAASNVWFTEGIAMYANYLVGKVTGKTNYWDFSTIDAYLAEYDTISLTDWQQRYGDYGAAYAFMIYLSEHYSPGHLKSLFQDPRSDRMEALRDYLAGYGIETESLLADWAVANAFDLSEGRYGYADLSLGLPMSRLPSLSGDTLTLPPWTVHYYRLSGSADGAAVRLVGQPGLAARLVAKQVDGRTTVQEFKKGADGELYCQSSSGGGGVELILVAANTGERQQVKVSLEMPTPGPEDSLEIALLPDLLVPGRYTVLVKTDGGLDGPPVIEVSGIRGGRRLAVAQAWPDEGLYVAEAFDVGTVGTGPVLVTVTGKKGGKEVTAKQTFQL